MKRFCMVPMALALSAAVCLGADAASLRKVNLRTARIDDCRGGSGAALSGNPKTVGTQIGTTTIDWPSNGNVLNQIAVDNDGGVHFGWTYRDDAGTAASRRMMYNYRAPDGAYLGATAFSDIPGNRWGSINCTHDGIGLGYFYYTDDGGNYAPMFAYDAGPGLGVFTLVPIDSAEANALWGGVAWIRNDKNRNPSNSDTLYVMAQGDVDQPVFISSYDRGLTWNDWTDLQDGGVFLPAFPEQQIAAGAAGKVAISLVDAANQQVYRESNDYGVSWSTTTVAIDPLTSCPLGDTLLPYIHTSVFYDNNNDLHISNAYYSYNINHTGDSTLLYCGILDWTAANGVRYITRELTTNIQWYATNALNYAWPNMVQVNYGSYVVSFTKFDSIDVAANGYANGEIYHTYSQDGGASWSVPYNITQSPTPGAAAGSCEDDGYPDCAIYGDTLHIIWLNSLDAGQALQGYGTTTEDGYWHLFWPPPGVASVPLVELPQGFTVNQNLPNPVRHSAEISFDLPRAGAYSLKVFNAAGQEVGEVEGQGRAGVNSVRWSARGVPAGVYFYKLESGGSSATRKMVVVR